MTDPWADVRELSRQDRPIPDSLAFPLLTDADALLAVVPFARHKQECQIARAWGDGPGGTFTEPHCNCGYDEAFAALPERLKTTSNGE